MPELPDALKAKLLGFSPVRSGYDIPDTWGEFIACGIEAVSPRVGAFLGKGVRDVVCWNFALTGGRMAVQNPLSPPNIINSIIDWDYSDNVVLPAAIMNCDALYPNHANELRALRYFLPLALPEARIRAVAARRAKDALEEQTALAHRMAERAARDGRYLGQANAEAARLAIAHATAATAEKSRLTWNDAQKRFAENLYKIIAESHNFTVRSHIGTYSIHIRSSEWFNTDHWAIGYTLPGKPQRQYIQTITGTPLSHSCSTVWDEGYPIVSFGIDGLLPQQIALIERMKYAPCSVCRANHTEKSHGYLPSAIHKWHHCTNCGRVYCPAHGAALLGKAGVFDGTRVCGKCHQRTRLF